jgi:hypothetical protein
VLQSLMIFALIGTNIHWHWIDNSLHPTPDPADVIAPPTRDFLKAKRPTQIVNRVVPSICSVRSIITRGWWPSDRVRHHILKG